MNSLTRNSRNGLSIGQGEPDNRVIDTSPGEFDWLARAAKMLAENDFRRGREPQMFNHQIDDL